MKATKRNRERGREGKRERERKGPLWIFFRTASSPPCRCLPLHPLSGSVHDVLRARATPDEGSKKIQPPICRVGGLFNCDIQYLFAIHLFFFPVVSPSVGLSVVVTSWSFISVFSVIFEGVELAHKGSLLVNLSRFLLVLLSLFSFLFPSTWLLRNNNETNPSDTPCTLIPCTARSSSRPLESLTDTNCVSSRVIARKGYVLMV